ncbi:MAG TPA: glycoside hydrolase domain-containing protein [Thermomicrobiaceae bacterium]|nr:glycoside hydrolase domain-containing protein [Thermomicrobiaceae bacterium]
MAEDYIHAYDNGEGATDNAATVAHQDGFAANATIYFDLEAVGTGNDNEGYSCLNLAQEFISGWDAELELDGFAPGLYGPICTTGTPEDSMFVQMVSTDPVPDAIAPGDNIDPPTGTGSWVYGLKFDSCALPDEYWNNNQRIRQLANNGGGGRQTQTFSYGGLALTVDEDCADGPLEGPTSYSTNNCNFYSGNN